MGIMTTEEYYNKRKGRDNPQIPVPAKLVRANGKMIYKVKMPSAPLGNSQTTVCIENKKKLIKMIDGLYICSGKTDKDKYNLFLFLLSNGFEDAKELINKKPAQPKKEIKYIYCAGHPENSDNEKMAGETSVTVEGESIPLEIKNGIIKTEDKRVFDKLVENGYYDAGKIEIKQGTLDPEAKKTKLKPSKKKGDKK